MSILNTIFEIISVVFAVTAIITGIQAIIDPISFSRSFGLPVAGTSSTDYVSLMGVRQLGTGITLLTFAYQRKWREMATILAIIGIVVAGTDGVYLARSGRVNLAMFHAIPGALISLLAAAVLAQ